MVLEVQVGHPNLGVHYLLVVLDDLEAHQIRYALGHLFGQLDRVGQIDLLFPKIFVKPRVKFPKLFLILILLLVQEAQAILFLQVIHLAHYILSLPSLLSNPKVQILQLHLLVHYLLYLQVVPEVLVGHQVHPFQSYQALLFFQVSLFHHQYPSILAIQDFQFCQPIQEAQ